MRRIEILIERKPATLDKRMLITDQTNDLVDKKIGQVQLFGRFRPVPDDDIELPVLEREFVIERRPERMKLERRIRRRLPKSLDNRRHEQNIEVIRTPDAITPHRSGRIEIVLLNLDPLDLPQRILRRFEQTKTVFGGHHARLAAHEQRIAGDVAQTPERRANGGLGRLSLTAARVTLRSISKVCKTRDKYVSIASRC